MTPSFQVGFLKVGVVCEMASAAWNPVMTSGAFNVGGAEVRSLWVGHEKLRLSVHGLCFRD